MMTSEKKEVAVDVSLRCKRIILPSELTEFKKFLKTSWLKEEYGDVYDRWLDEAIGDVSKKTREAYAVFKAGYNQDQAPSSKIVGGCILNLVNGKMMELKSFVDCGEEDVCISIHKTVEQIAIERGYQGIYTTVPTTRDKLLVSFIERKYTIGGVSERYEPSRLTYFLTKKLQSRYVGDPYDWQV